MKKIGVFASLIIVSVVFVYGLVLTFNLTGFAVYESTGFDFSFVNPTPANDTKTTNTTIRINATLENATEINEFIFNWNNTNYTFYSPNLTLMMDFNEDENNTKEIGEAVNDAGLISELSGLWHLNNNNFSDSSGKGNDGSAQGGLDCTDDLGIFGDGCEFDGVDDFINMSNSASLQYTPNLTVGGWFKVLSDDNENSGLISKDDGNTERSWFLNFDSDPTDELTFIITTDGSTLIRSANTSADDLVGEWHHIAGVVDDLNKEVYLYVDGQQIGTATSFTGSLYQSTSPVEIGRFNGGDSSARYPNMRADEIFMFNKTLSSSEIKNLYERSITKENSKYLNNATIAGAKQTSDGKYNKGFVFDGVNDYLEVPDDPSLDIAQNITLEVWVNVRNKSSSNDEEYGIISKGGYRDVTGTFGAYNLIYDRNTRDVFRIELNDSATPFPEVFGTTTPEIGKWYHVAGTYNGSYVCIYVNGIKENCENEGSFSIATNDLPLFIGVHGSPPNSGGFFNGTIDEPRIWNRSLSEDEIKQRYFSNLRKHDSGNWSFYTNQSKNSTSGLDTGTYTYKTISSDTDGDFAESETRHITIANPVELNLPVNKNNSVDLNSEINFTCTITDNTGVNNVSLYSDYKGSWDLIETKEISGTQNQTSFNRSILSDLGDETQFFDDGIRWNCNAHGNYSGFNFADSNFTFSSWNFGNYTELSKITKTDNENLTLEDNDTLQELPNEKESNFFFNMSGKSSILLYHLNNNSDFGESNTLFYDFSGSGNNGTCSGTNCPSFTSSGKLNGAFDFDGDSDYIETDVNDVVSGENALTVSAWVLRDTNTNGAIVDQYNSGSNATFLFYFFNGKLRGLVNDGSGNEFGDISDTNVSTGEWHHVAMTWNSADDQITGYVDGVKQSSAASTTISALRSTPQNPIQIGGNWNFFNGSIDEVSVFKSSLSEKEIKKIYDNQKGKYLAEGEYRSQIYNSSSLADFNNFSWSKYFPYGKELPGNQEIETEYETGNANMSGNKLLYHFNNNISAGESSTLAYDFSGNGNNASILNGTSVNAEGRFDKGVLFDGTDDQIHVDGNLSMQNSPMTLSIWFYVDGKNVNNYIADNRDPGNWWFIMDYTGSGICQDFDGDLCFDNRLMANDSDWNEKEWTHVVVTDNTSTAEMYVNGRLVDTGTGEGNNMTTNLRFGTRFTNVNYFNGTMDEIALWNRSLSSSEILDIYQRGALRLDLQTRTSNDGTNFPKHELPNNKSDELWADMTGNVLLMHFNNDSSFGENSTHVFDFSYSGNNGTITGNPIFNNSGYINGAYEFDGDSDFMNISNSSSIRITGDISYGGWVNFNSISGTQGFVSYSHFRTDDFDAEDKNIVYQSRFGPSTVDYWHEYGAGQNVQLVFDFPHETNKWYHVFIVRDQELNEVKFYLDGDFQETQTYSNEFTGGGNTSLYLGVDAGFGGNFFNGSMDEVAIWNRSLTENEIKYIYDAQKDGYIVQDNPAGEINSSTQYLQYKANFYSDNTSSTPYLQFVKTNYTDLTSPTIQFVSPTTSEGKYTSQNFIEANIMANDDTGIDSITVNLYKSGSLVRTSSSSVSPFFHNFTGLSNGDYYLNATVLDNDGNNASTETRKITIDLPVSTSGTTVEESSEDGGISEEAQCIVKSDCSADEYCLNNQCVKLFDVIIEDFESPVNLGEFFDFTYFIKGMADFNGDVIIDFWIEDSSGNKISSGSDTIFLGSFEEKTKTTKIFLPSDAVSGRYTFYVEVSYDNYSAQSHRTIEISVNEDGTAEITPISGLNITAIDLTFYLIIAILVVGIMIVMLLIYWNLKNRSNV